MITGKKIFHNNQFEAEDALRKDGTAIEIFFAINIFEFVVAGLTQPGSMTGFGNAIFLYSSYVRKCEPSRHLTDVVGPCPSRTVLANWNGCKVKKNIGILQAKSNARIAT